MAKRFTDTDKYKKPFIRSLPGAYKLFWDYLYHECDHAGIWIVDFEIAQIYLGSDMQVDRDNALGFFNKDEVRVIEFSGGKKWFIIPFIEFQYGELNEQNRVHKSVINILKKENLYKENKGLIRGLQALKDKDKNKDMDKDKDRVPKKNEVIEYFSERGNMIESDIPLEAENFINHYEERDWKNSSGKKITEWKRQAGTWNNNYQKFNSKRLQQKELQPAYYQEL